MFHYFHDGRHPRGQGSLAAEQFRAIIGFVGQERILPAKEWVARALSRSLRPDDLCLTFDDNLRCQYDVAYPAMRDLGLTGLWFVYTSVVEGRIEPLEIYRLYRNTAFRHVNDFYADFERFAARSAHGDILARALSGFNAKEYFKEYAFYTDEDRRFRFIRDDVLGPDRYRGLMDAMMAASGFRVEAAAKDLWMDEDCLRRLHGEGHVIGLHSHSHPMRLAELSPERQESEYRVNIEHLRRVLAEAPTTVSHPCNSYNGETLRILAGLGIRLGFRADMEEVASRGDLEQPRIDPADILAMMR
ncbi:MAG: polysaccharide deacetylase family protein [Elusimicrobia bacterium]|nr:polysaccharide deacetylase family protein [Elusimicrobiota bacterium]